MNIVENKTKERMMPIYPCRSSAWEKYQNKNEDEKVLCCLCPRECSIPNGDYGQCHVRGNIDGQLYLFNYGQVVCTRIDTLRNRPIYLWPDNNIRSLSIGLTGCNNQCGYCQNYKISQVREYVDYTFLSPDDVVSRALELGVDFISYTFTEPIVWWEYFGDVAKIAHENGLKNCVKTAGNIKCSHLFDFMEYIDAINIDIKDFSIVSPTKYNFFLYTCLNRRIHVEMSHLVVEGLNDDDESIQYFCNRIGERECNLDIGLHLLRHYPAWKSSYPITSDSTLKKFSDYCLDFGFKNVFHKDG